MSEIGLVEIFGMAEAIALIGTLFVILYFSRKQMQSLSLDIETKVLNDGFITIKGNNVDRSWIWRLRSTKQFLISFLYSSNASEYAW